MNCVFACMDGNIFHNGVILYEHYKDIDKIKNLIQLGAINSLGEEINVPVGAVHTLNQRHAGVTTFFVGMEKKVAAKHLLFHLLKNTQKVVNLKNTITSLKKNLTVGMC